MLSVEEAQARVLASVAVLGSETVSLSDALDRVLAEPVSATRDLPPWDNSSMDGYAIRAGDTAEATAARPVRLRVVGEIHAGAVAAAPCRSGEVYRILTGAPMPEGTDAVIPQEEVRREGDLLLVPRLVARGHCVRGLGEDIRTGERVLDPGALLRPAALGVLAALGRPTIRVYQRPRVAEIGRASCRERVYVLV